MSPGGQRFVVRIAPLGREISVRAGQSVLEAALEAGLNLPQSCRSGHCGSCRARLVRGEIAYPGGLPAGLAPREAREGEVLLCQARPRTDLEIEARPIASVGDVEIKSLPCRIERKTLLAPEVMQLMLRLPRVERLEFEPGQHLDVLLPGGLRRSFSIASPPWDSRLIELHVRRVPGGRFTGPLFEDLAAGGLLRIEGPLGEFRYRESPSPLLLVAGGTGFAPLKSMLRYLLERGSTRCVHLFWGARTAVDLYEEALVLEWAGRRPGLRFTAVLSQADRTGAAHRELGLVSDALLAHYPRFSNEEVYAAGPPALIEALRVALPARGVGAQNLRLDSFDYAPGG